MIGPDQLVRVDAHNFMVQKARLAGFEPSETYTVFREGALAASKKGRLLYLDQDMSRNTLVNLPECDVDRIVSCGDVVGLADNKGILIGRISDA